MNLLYLEKYTLLEICIPEINLTLKHGVDIDTRKPYPNKNYFVGCRKQGRKAMEGLLIDIPEHQNKFTAIYRWNNEEEGIVTHKVNYIVLDNEFDLVSDNMMLWLSIRGSDFKNRTPEKMKHAHDDKSRSNAPVNLQPRMDLIQGVRVGHFKENVNDYGLIDFREETFTLPTIPREQYEFLNFNARLPSFNNAFSIKTVNA